VAEVITDAAGLAELVQRLRAEAPTAVGVTVEPDGPRPRHLMEDYRVGTVSQIGLSLRDDGSQTFILDAGVPGIGELIDVLAADDGPYLVFHDAHAALFRLGTRIGHPVEPPRLSCTETAAVVLAEGTRPWRDRPTLPELADKLLQRSFPEPALEAAVAPPEIVAARTDALLPLMQAMTPLLRKRDLVPVYQLETKVLAPTIAMERNGFAIDGARFQQIAESWQRERNETEDPARQQRLDKLLSTYSYWPREYIRGGRIHTMLHPLAADSGRFSCTDPNLQQVPSEHTAPGLRSCFGASEGSVLIIADYAQIELRVAAHLAPCDAMRQVFREGRDPHRATAATITGRPESEITDHERKLAKAVNFGFLFGMGAKRFRKYAADSYGVQLDEREAQAAREAFLRTYPGIAAWHRRVGSMGRNGRSVTVRTALGRRKRFEPDRFSYNAALNIPVQGTAAEGFKHALVRLLAPLRELGGRPVLCVHDEYIAEVPRSRAEEGRALVERIMAEAMATVVDSVPIEVEAVFAESWGAKS
jgi:DNA polymerase-1